MKLFPGDWMRDTRRLTPQAKGCWIDIISYMWGEPTRGLYERTWSEVALELACSESEAKLYIQEIKDKGIANVIIRNDSVSIKSRRMLREEKRREDNAYYQRLHRSKQSVSIASAESKPKTLDVRCQTLDVKQLQDKEINKEKPPDPPKGGQVRVWFEAIWKAYPAERRHGKEVAWKRFEKTVPDLETAKTCARALEYYMSSKAAQEGFILRASKWFAEWMDHKPEGKTNESSQRRNSERSFIERADMGTAGENSRGGGFAKAERVLASTTNLLSAKSDA